MSHIGTIAVVGAGKMGTNVLHQLPRQYHRIVIDKNLSRAQAVAAACGAEGSQDLGAACQAQIVLLVLPPKEMLPAAGELASRVEGPTLWINMATSVSRSDLQQVVGDRWKIVDIKIIGQAEEMARGGQVCLIVDAEDDDAYRVCLSLFSGLGTVLRGDGAQFSHVNMLATEQAIRAALVLNEQLQKDCLPPHVIQAAVHSTMVGTLRNFPWPSPDYFVADLILRVRAELGDAG